MKRVNSTLRFFMALAILFASVSVFGQNLTVSGVVYDIETAESLPGVTVLVSSTGNGTITGMDGDFSIQVQKGDEVSFSFIGYKTQTVLVSSATSLKVNLEPDVALLGEVIAIGYGVQKKEDKTGALFSVGSDELQTVAVQDPMESLQGKVAGVTIRKSGSDPNSGFDIKVRGASSLTTGTNPLYVVDGVVGVDATTISPEDIASINVLKDASSAAIYGSRGANGVIIITTKRGEEGKSKIEYNGYVTADVISARAKLDLMSADEYRAYGQETGIDIRDLGASTDWQDEIYRTGITHNHNVALSGGNKSGTYRASISHNDMQGLVLNSGKQRTIMRLNAMTKAFNDKLTLSMNLSNTIEHNDYVNYGSSGADGSLFQAFQRNPTASVYEDDGVTFWQDPTPPVNNYSNPVAILNDIQNERDAKRLLASAKAELEIIDGLKLTVNGAYTRDDSESFYFEKASNGPLNGEGVGRRSYQNSSSKLLEVFGSYNKVFGEVHTFSAVGGYSYQLFGNDGFGAGGGQPQSDYTQSNDLASLAVLYKDGIYSYKDESSLISGFGRVAYNYDNKYYLTGTLRRDGSSKFGENNKWGWFPSASAAWNLKNESFLYTNELVSQAKLRVGYGQTGNQEGFSAYAPYALYGVTNSTLDAETGEYTVEYGAIQNPNPDLKWEVTTELNVGVDFGVFDSRLTASVDYFNKKTTDMVYNYGVDKSTNLTGSTLANGGAFDVNGLEAVISAYIFDNDNVSWNSTLTFTHSKAVVKSLEPASDNFYPVGRVLEGYLQEPLGYGTSTQILKEGVERNAFYGPKFAGIKASSGEFVYEKADGTVATYDRLNEDDWQILGYAQPDFELGWSNYVKFLDNWDANITFRGMFGHDILNGTEMVFGNPYYFPTRNVLSSAVDNTELNGPSNFSDYFLEKGNFIRLENITIGYNFDTSATSYLGKARVFVAANNLFTLSSYKGIDPSTIGIDIFNVYPKSTSFTCGVNLTF